MSFSSGHALIIGVGAYQYLPHLDVPLTVADAQALDAVLRDPQHCGYPPEQVTLMTDTNATHADILDAFDNLATRIEPQSTILLFYSGHGHYGDDGTYYLMSHDTQLSESRKTLAGTALSHQELLLKLQALKAERVLLIFNACHAGEISPTLDGSEPFTGESLPSHTAAALLATGSGRIIITACREHQYSFVGRGRLTLFGQALVDGLRGKGIRSYDKYISAFDLYTHLYKTVGEAVKRDVPEIIRLRYHKTQEPELTVIRGIGAFAVALHPNTSIAGEIDLSKQHAAGPPVRQLSVEESKVAFEHIQNGGVNFGQQNVVEISGDVTGSDKIDASGSQDMIIRPSGPVTQRNINTGGGDYAERNIDKRVGVFVSGGQVSGPVIGINPGTVTTHINNLTVAESKPASLEAVLDWVYRRLAIAQQHGEEDLAEDFNGIITTLRAALRAQNEGKADRRLAKLEEARTTLQQLNALYSNLQDIIRMLEKVV